MIEQNLDISTLSHNKTARFELPHICGTESSLFIICHVISQCHTINVSKIRYKDVSRVMRIYNYYEGH